MHRFGERDIGLHIDEQLGLKVSSRDHLLGSLSLPSSILHPPCTCKPPNYGTLPFTSAPSRSECLHRFAERIIGLDIEEQLGLLEQGPSLPVTKLKRTRI
jgi:hypothetical protein